MTEISQKNTERLIRDFYPDVAEKDVEYIRKLQQQHDELMARVVELSRSADILCFCIANDNSIELKGNTKEAYAALMSALPKKGSQILATIEANAVERFYQAWISSCKPVIVAFKEHYIEQLQKQSEREG